MFYKFHLGPSLAAPFSLQLVDGSETAPIGRLDDVPVNIGDIWVLEDSIIVDMPETDDAQIILGRPIFVTAGCYIDVRKGRITFEVKECYAVFCHMQEDIVSPNSSLLDALTLSPEINMEDVLKCEDPPDSDWISCEDLNQGYVKVEFAAPMPPNTPKVEVPVLDESSISDYCRFAQVVLSMPPMEGFDANFDLGVE